MLKTYIIDGDKGGVGKSLAARALVHHFISKSNENPPKIAVYDADLSNPDICGEGGLTTDPNLGIIAANLIDLSTENGWIDFAGLVAKLTAAAQTIEIRCIVNMPAQIGTRAFDGSIPIVNEVLREANAIPVWLLSRTQESLRALAYRIGNMPARYERGLIIKNLFFGSSEKFLLWEGDNLHELLNSGNWLETELPELNDSLTVMIGRQPFHEALSRGINNRPLELGYRLALQSWLTRAGAAMATVDLLAEPQ